VQRYEDMTTKNAALLTTALAISLGSPATAQAAGRCTQETLRVHGAPVTASYCVTALGKAAPGHELPVRVAEAYRGPGGELTQEATLQFIAGEGSSRVIQDVALARLGLAGTLHLTLLLQGGLIRIDSALLTPGAVTIK
jgi:hypothetical protein